MGNTFYFNWEANFMIFLQSIMGDLGDKVANALSFLGEDILYVLIIGLTYWCFNKRTGVYIGINLTLSGILFSGIKNVALRRRPYMDIDGIKCLRPIDSSADIMDINAQGYSFPSGHSSNAVSVYGTLAYYQRKKILTIIAFVIPFLIGFSRVMLGVHFPTDVITGWVIGALLVFLSPIVAKRVKNKKLCYLIIFLVALLGFTFCKTNDYYTNLGMLTGILVGDLVEESKIKFEKPEKWYFYVTRVLGGGIIYFALNAVLKLPFPSELLESATFMQHVIRFVRYAIILFIEIGLYPKLFKLEKKKK